MDPLISDTTTNRRMEGLECFLERYLGTRRPEYGLSDDELGSIEMPDPLRRFFKFAGRWPGQNPLSPYSNTFCSQDALAAITRKEYAPALEHMDGRLVFVWENQGVWVAATERTGIDPAVWLSEDCSHREKQRVWRQLENSLSHFLVSFVLQELLYGSEVLAAAPDAVVKLRSAGLQIEPVWMNGEYSFDDYRPSYLLVGNRFLVRQALGEADDEDWYGCMDAASESFLASLGLPSQIQ